MSWRELLATPESHTLPWTGGRTLHARDRSYRLEGALPEELGWHRFETGGSRKATWTGPDALDPTWAEERETVRGYLVGDRILPDHIAVRADVHAVFEQTEQVWLVEPGLDRFARVLTARSPAGLVYIQQEFPLGPESEVQRAYEDRAEDLDAIRGVPPALDLAFRWIRWQRLLQEERNREVDLWAEIAEEEAVQARQVEEANAWIEAQRALAREPNHRFNKRAREALERSGSILLDSRDGRTDREKVLLFRFQHRRYECVVDAATLRVIDSGICLEGHDDRFTLESLPGVIDEAIQTGQLHVYRHAGEEAEW